MKRTIEVLKTHIASRERELQHLEWLAQHGHARYTERMNTLKAEITDCKEGLVILQERAGGLLCD